MHVPVERIALRRSDIDLQRMYSQACMRACVRLGKILGCCSERVLVSNPSKARAN